MEVCHYISEYEYKQQRIESAHWVHFDNNVSKVLEGKYNELVPLHVELYPTYLCNYSCPWCSSSHTRYLKSNRNNDFHPSNQSMRWELLKDIILKLSFLNIGIQWVGGEPLLFKNIVKGINYADELNLKQCLFTNGSLLDEFRIKSLLESNLVFIRISLNCISPKTHTEFHNLRSSYYSKKVKINLSNLIDRKNEYKSNVQVGVSIVLDNTNICDFAKTLEFLLTLARKGSNLLNYIIIRSVYAFPGTKISLTGFNLDNVLTHSEKLTKIIKNLQDHDVRMVYPPNYIFSNMISGNQKQGCLAANWFSEIRPNGDMMFCSDIYGDTNYTIGNIGNNSIQSIYNSLNRKNTFMNTLEKNCFQNYCPNNGRGYMLNYIFYQIEKKRAEGKIREVEDWIMQIRSLTKRPEHSFFI